VALGASNLTRGFETVVRVSIERWGGALDVLAALGHGRSYGLRSRLLVRALPSILECALWEDLAAGPTQPTRGLITDVGNDVLYGVGPQQILEWVDTCAQRLQQAGAELVITGLPLASIDRVGPARFLAFRSVLVPSCRLSLAEVRARSRELGAGLAQIASARGAVYRPLPGAWYGIDPIHIKPALWAASWREILLAGDAVCGPPPAIRPLAWARLYAARPARRWLFGIEQRQPQPSLRLGDTRIGLY
jgi:hypothetical protein